VADRKIRIERITSIEPFAYRNGDACPPINKDLAARRIANDPNTRGSVGRRDPFRGRRERLPGFLGDAGHEWLVGATGAGKSTGFLAAIRGCLENGIAFAVLDPHGPLAAGARFIAASLGRSVAVVDPHEPESLQLDLFDGIDPMSARRDEERRVAASSSRRSRLALAA
jgi:hypothetical protein